MNPLRKEREFENLNDNNPNRTPGRIRESLRYQPSENVMNKVFPSKRWYPKSKGIVEPVPVPCLPQIQEPYEGAYYVAFNRKRGPIGYIGMFNGKHKCSYYFNYYGMTINEFDGNVYLFKQVLKRENPILDRDIDISMRDRHFIVYGLDGTTLIQNALFVGRTKDWLIFEDEDYNRLLFKPYQYNYELIQKSENAVMKEGSNKSREELRKQQIDDDTRKQLLHLDTRSSSNDNSNIETSRMKSKAKRGRATKTVKTTLEKRGINYNQLNESLKEQMIKRAEGYENAGSSEEEPNYVNMIKKKETDQNVELSPGGLFRQNSEESPLTAAARYSLDRAGVSPKDPKTNAVYSEKLEEKKKEIKARLKHMELRNKGLAGSSNENTNETRKRNVELSHRVGLSRFKRVNSLNVTRKRLLPKIKARELLRNTIKTKLLPKARSKLNKNKHI